MKTKIDLGQLVMKREQPPPAPPRAGRRQLLTRVVLPGLLLAGFAALVIYAARETLSPPRTVTVIPVISSQAALDAPPDTPLFRAAGWVEPRPTPTLVTALADGVVERLLVVESQQVKQGQVIARLVSADAKLALESAEAEVDLRDSGLASAKAARVATLAKHKSPVHLQAELADAETALAKAESELANLPNLITAADARHEYAKASHDGLKKAATSVPAISLAKAYSEWSAAAAFLKELQTRKKRLPIEIVALKAKQQAQKLKLERKVDETRHVGEADAAVKAAMARVRQAKAVRDVAKLRLERTEIKSPASGRVLALVARPGTRVSGLTSGSLQDSGTVVTLYDPESLQIRVDVRLDDVGKVLPGQKVSIETAALPDTKLKGEVLLATSQADIQKNTLSVKVAILRPPSTLKPEMLCQVTFLSPPRPAGGSAPRGSETARMLVPKQLIDSSDGSPGLWVVDQQSGTARLRAVGLGLTAGDLVEVVSGLDSSDKLIVGGREGLKAGTRVRITGEDESMGITAPSARRRRDEPNAGQPKKK